MDEFNKAEEYRVELRKKLQEAMKLETKHSLAVRKLRNLYLLASDETRALDRDMLSYPVTTI